MAPKKTAGGPGKLTPTAQGKLKDLTNTLQKTGAVLDANPAAHCENYISCKKLTKIIDEPATGGRKLVPPVKPIPRAKTPVKKPLI